MVRVQGCSSESKFCIFEVLELCFWHCRGGVDMLGEGEREFEALEQTYAFSKCNMGNMEGNCILMNPKILSDLQDKLMNDVHSS